MDLHIAMKWVEALRSGRYRQTGGKLRGTADGDIQEVGFCCLGVLCDLHREFINDQMGGEVASWSWESGYHCGDYLAKSVLPENVKRWAGLESQNPSFPSGDCSIYLSDLNDTGHSFEVIAGKIEAKAATL